MLSESPTARTLRLPATPGELRAFLDEIPAGEGDKDLAARRTEILRRVESGEGVMGGNGAALLTHDTRLRLRSLASAAGIAIAEHDEHGVHPHSRVATAEEMREAFRRMSVPEHFLTK